MLEPVVSLVNGVKTQQIDIQNRGMAFGDGVFETMRLTQGCIPLLDLHKARLHTGIKALGLNYSEAALNKHLAQLFSIISDSNIVSGRVKLIVARGQGGQGVIPSADAGVDVSILLYASQLAAWVQPAVALKTSKVQLPHNVNLAGIKHLNRLDYVLAAQVAMPAENEQVLLLDVANNIIETLHHNVFVIRGSEVDTPSLARCGVNGVFKQWLANSVIPKVGLQLVERETSLADAESCDTCFITNAYSGLTPVTAINGHLFNSCENLNAITGQINQILGDK